MQLEVITHEPAGPARPTPLLFVHGAWHQARCWERFQPFFAEQGYRSYALSLRGHGASPGRERLRWHSAADYVADVARVVATLPQPPVLIGHSMGGYVVQKYLERATAPAAVLMASIPAAGIWRFALRELRRHPWPFLKSQLTLNPWHMVGTPELMAETFFSPGLSPADQARYFAQLQPESFRIELDALALALPRPARVKTPLLVLAAADDRVFSVAEQHATARAYGVEAVVFPNMAHDMMLEPAWRQVADGIISWLAGRSL